MWLIYTSKGTARRWRTSGTRWPPQLPGAIAATASFMGARVVHGGASILGPALVDPRDCRGGRGRGRRVRRPGAFA